jgi:hypothetical protein
LIVSFDGLRPSDVKAGSRPAPIGRFLLLFKESLARRWRAAYAVLSASKVSEEAHAFLPDA